MSIFIQEYFGFNEHKRELQSSTEIVESNMSIASIDPNALIVYIEGIHVGPTRNYTRYMEQALKGSIKSWTSPYLKPLILHHNEKDGRIIGRINECYYTTENTKSGTGALVFVTNVPDKEGKEQIEDGRLMTVSIGITGHDVRCSICGHSISSLGECDEHERGNTYDGEICYWDIYSMEGKELSYVIVPSDKYAQNIKIQKVSNKSETNINENLKGVFGLEVTESVKLQEAIKEKDHYKSFYEMAEKKLEDSKAEINSLKESLFNLEEMKKEKEANSIKLKEADQKIMSLQKELLTAENNLKEEKALRENLEKDAIEKNMGAKTSLIENLVLLRKIAGKPEMKTEDLKERTQESICDAIKDLKEELGVKADIMTIKPAINPSLIEDKDDKEIVKDKKKDLKEDSEDLRASFLNLF